MIRKISGIILFGFFAIAPGLVQAQEAPVFSSDPSIFVAELEGMFSRAPANQRQAANTLISNIRQSFNTGLIPSDHQQAMIETTNLMQAQRLRPFPYLFGYVSSAMTYLTDKPDALNFEDWNRSVQKIIKDENERQLQSYLERSGDFFRRGVLFRSNSVQWQMIEGEWTMAGDSLPGFSIREARLVCYASRDSISISGAAGLFFPVENEWVGTSGLITWERAGYPADDVYAELHAYTIGLSSSWFNADTATMHFPDYFSRPLPGSLAHRVVAGLTPETANYPRFSSFNFFLEIRNIFDGIDYAGGFTLEGNRIIGYGTGRNNAQLTIRRGGIPIMKFSSHSFVIRSDRITSQRATFSLHHENDSIFHPGLQFRYLDSERNLMLLRSGQGISQSPFFNTYHQLDMSFEALYWNLDEDEITFGVMQGLRRESEAVFESVNFFTHSRFNQIQRADARHPLIVVNNFLQGSNRDVFYYEELATYMNVGIEQASAMLIDLANLGFLHYNPNDGKAILRERAQHYIDAVNERADYDVIRIHSKVDGTVNARLNLSTFDLDIFGVPEVNLSNTQMVFVYPGNNMISMKKGLDFLFQGRIHAGYFEFYATQCAFLYDDFKLNLTNIDSMGFNVPVRTNETTFRQKLERVRTVISNISGDLLIDYPDNKSGIKNFPRYPIFDSKDDSYVYFDAPYIQNGVYKRDTFYYHILPFTIDSLNDFTTEGVSFKGYFNSGNIFPELEEPLSVQPDFSLGFVRSWDENGLPIYGGKARAFVELSLSHQGLRGRGTVNFNESVLRSEDFIFHPDSMMAVLQTFTLAETMDRISNPAVNASDVKQKWYPNDDRMVLETNGDIPFEMYNKQVALTGNLNYSTSGLHGAGKLTYANAVFHSSGFHFSHSDFGADNSHLVLSSPESGKAMEAKNYSFRFDLGIRQGQFKSKNANSSITFPLNKYLALMDDFRWEADYEEVHLSNSSMIFRPGASPGDYLDAQKLLPNFISLRPGQDSLGFAAGAARFDLREQILNIQEVPYIEVADAAIFPVGGRISIHRNAEMQPLHGATLIAGAKNRYHNLYNLSAQINGRKNYSGSGMYDYVDAFDKIQPVFFKQISPDGRGISEGLAEISEEDDFSLSPFFDFHGKIRFSADKKAFAYDGGFRINHQCSHIFPEWVKFEGEVDRTNIRLPVSEPPLKLNDLPLSASLLFSPANNQVYSGFLQEQRNVADQQLISAYGHIWFEPENRVYIIEEPVHETEPDQITGALKLFVDRCILSGEGGIDFDLDLGRVSFETSGKTDYYMLPDSTSINLFAAIDFFFDENALDFINKSLNTSQLSGMDPNNPVFVSGLQHMLGRANAQGLLSELRMYGTFRRFPRELSQTMILSDLKMNWNENTRSFTSSGPVGIATLNNRLVNRYVDGHVELIKRRTGDVLNMYFQISNTEWFFFSYSGGVMQAISSNEEFNNLLLNLRENRRTLSSRGDEATYQFIISTIQQRNAFLRRVR
jgi:hypothetical protein